MIQYLLLELVRQSWPGVLSEYLTSEEDGADKLKVTDTQAPDCTVRRRVARSFGLPAKVRRHSRTSSTDLLIQRGLVPRGLRLESWSALRLKLGGVIEMRYTAKSSLIRPEHLHVLPRRVRSEEKRRKPGPVSQRSDATPAAKKACDRPMHHRSALDHEQASKASDTALGKPALKLIA